MYGLPAYVYQIFRYCAYIFLSVGAWTILFTLSPIFLAYRKLIDFILKLKYKNKYGGLIDISDGFYLKPNLSMSCTITTINIVKSDKEKNIYEEVRLILQEKIFNEPALYPKLSHSINNFGGYGYLLNNNHNVDDVLQLITVPENVPFDEEYIKTITAEINSSELSLNNSLLWDVYVSAKPLKSKGNDNFYRYPMIFRFHHAVGDGTSLIALFIRVLGNDASKNYSEELFKKRFKVEHSETKKNRTYKYILLKMFRIIKFWFTVIFISFGRLGMKNLFCPANENALHSTSLSGQKIVAWTTEDHLECVNMVKKLRKRVPNTKFSGVVSTAIASSLTNFFKRVSHFVVTKLIGNFPISFANETLGFNKQTFILTNVPGGSEVKIFNDCVVEQIIPIAPNLRHVAVSFAILTYDDRFQIGLLIDKALLNSQKEAQKIVDDILESIKVLDSESYL